MSAKKAPIALVRLVVPAGAAKPSPPVGPALGQHGVNIMSFCKEFNAKTSEHKSEVPVPVEIAIYGDKSFCVAREDAADVVLHRQGGGGDEIVRATGTRARGEH